VPTRVDTLLIAALATVMSTQNAPAPSVRADDGLSTSIRTAAAAVEQTEPGARPAAAMVESFDGLGVGFEGPQGTYAGRNPSDSSLAVGPDHVVQIVNTRLAVFSKKGKRFERTGQVLYGPVATNEIFTRLGGVCESRNNGDAVVR